MRTSNLTANLSRAALVASVVVSLVIACSPTATTTKTDTLCTPGDYVFCRCRDREAGSKLCKDDAQSFGPCEPCETSTNPEGPLEPGDPGSEDPLRPRDGGKTDGAPPPANSCGDGVVQDGEDCDDKNDIATDGCDSTCKLAGVAPTLTNACPGLPVHVWGGQHRPTLVLKTNGSGNRSAAPACPSGLGPATAGAAGPDRVFAVVPHQSGTMRVVTSDVDFNSFLYVADACAGTANTWLKCVNDNGAVGGESMTFPVDAGKTYYVFVDGAGIDSSTYQGTARVTFMMQ